MKRTGFAAAAAVLLLLAGVWWWAGPRNTLDGPPKLTVSAGEEPTQVGYWSAQWDSPTTCFVACGDVPTAPYARSSQTVVYVREGTQALTLSYPVAPSHVTVSCTPDRGGETVRLYDGWGKRKLSIPLPEDFRGIYEVSERWQTVPPATGSAARGFLVVGEGEPVGDPGLAEPPALTVAVPGGTAVTARLGSYSWFVWLGGEEMEATIADVSHPLGMPDLPALSARPGERLELKFDVSPDELSLWAWKALDGAEQEPAQVELLPSGRDFLVPEGGEETVYEVRAGWHLAGDVWGNVSYLFAVP